MSFSWRERRTCHKLPLTRVPGYRRSHRGRQRPIIRSTRTLRIRQYNSLDFSTDVSTSPLRASPILPLTLSNFHEVSRVIGPIGQYRRTASLRAIATLAVFRRSTALRPRKAALVPLTKRTESIFIVNFGASAVLFFPAAPSFLLMHGSDDRKIAGGRNNNCLIILWQNFHRPGCAGLYHWSN